MKRLIFTLALGAFMLQSIAAESGMFSYDRTAVDQEMATLDNLEQYVLSNEGITLNALKAESNPLAEDITTAPFGALNIQEGPLGIPSILWGFCFSLAGILIVYLVTDDTQETKMALVGCIISAVLSGGAYWWNPW